MGGRGASSIANTSTGNSRTEQLSIFDVNGIEIMKIIKENLK